MKIEFLKLEAVLTGLTAPTRRTANGRSTARGYTSVPRMPTSRARGTRTPRRRRCRRVRVNRSPVARTTTFCSTTPLSATASPRRLTSRSRAWWLRKEVEAGGASRGGAAGVRARPRPTVRLGETPRPTCPNRNNEQFYHDGNNYRWSLKPVPTNCATSRPTSSVTSTFTTHELRPFLR